MNELVGVQCLAEGYFPQNTRLLIDVPVAASIEPVTFQLQLLTTNVKLTVKPTHYDLKNQDR